MFDCRWRDWSGPGDGVGLRGGVHVQGGFDRAPILSRSGDVHAVRHQDGAVLLVVSCPEAPHATHFHRAPVEELRASIARDVALPEIGRSRQLERLQMLELEKVGQAQFAAGVFAAVVVRLVYDLEPVEAAASFDAFGLVPKPHSYHSPGVAYTVALQLLAASTASAAG